MESINNHTWKKFIELLRLEKSDISGLYFYAVISGILSLSLPLGIQSVIHFIQSGQITTSWLVLVALVIAGVILTGIMQIMQLRITENIQQRIFVRYSFDFAHRFPRLNRSAIKGKIPTELMNRFFDVISLQKGFSKVLLDFTAAFLQIAFSLLVLSFYHPFYIAFSIILILLLVVIFRPFIQRGLDTSLKESKYKYATAFWLQEIAKADWSFRMTPNENLSLDKLDEHATNYLKSREDHFQVLWKQFTWMIAMKALIVASLLGLGGYLVISQQINLGQFVAAEVLILLLLAAVEKIIQTLETFYDVCTSLEKLEQVRDLPKAIADCEVEKSIELFPLELMRITPAENTTILTVKQNESIQIIGSEQLEMNRFMKKLIDPSADPQLAPRWNYHLPSPEDLSVGMEKIGWYAKGSHIIEGTLRENIQLGRENVSETRVKELLECLGVGYLYQRFPAGIEMMLSKGNKLLTETEREIVLITRAIAHNPSLLILSFVGSAIAKEKQEMIIKTIQQHLRETTFVLLSETPYDIAFPIVPFSTINA